MLHQGLPAVASEVSADANGKQIARSISRSFGSDQHTTALPVFGMKRRLARNECFAADGEAAGQVFRVTSGTLRLCKNAGGRRRIVEFLQPADLYGLASWAKHPFNVEAVTESTVSIYPRSQLHSVIAASPEIGGAIIRQQSEALASIYLQQISFGCASARMRVAAFLDRELTRQAIENNGCLHVAMGRKDIADHLGLTVETTCRALGNLRSGQIIEIPDRRHIRILDRGMLHAAAISGAGGP